MRKFDTKVQYLEYKVLRAVATHAWKGDLLTSISDIPKEIVPGTTPTMRCCVYKERAILSERVKCALGGDKSNPNVIEVLPIACDDCPVSGYEITNNCRGCIAHRCEDVCRMGAISYDEHQKAHIDKSKCVNCGQCAKVCPYGAITNWTRPCVNACKVKAIGQGEGHSTAIDNEKCISCGACVYQCPWGAITEKSFILNVIDFLMNKNQKTIAVVAPAVSSQFTYAKTGQVIAGLYALGFDDVVEAALGADIVAYAESKELAETKDYMTSSCCPAFVRYIESAFPELADHVSHNPSPAAAVAKHIKEQDPDVKIVFVGPCTAKKMEFQKPEVAPFIDSVITFSELQALFDSKDIEIETLEEAEFDGASYFGRIFARSGGLAEAIAQGLEEHGYRNFSYRPTVCSGISECKTALLKAKKGVLKENFIEGMACIGGCIGGAGCLTHGERNRTKVDEYGNQAGKSISDIVTNL